MEAEVRFFHTGDGDAILIRGGEECALVDGNFDRAGRLAGRVKEALRGARKLRFVCITHFDRDHIRGLGQFLMENFSEEDGDGRRIWRIGQVILPLSPVSLKLLKLLRRYEEASDLPRMKGDISRGALKLLQMLCDMQASGDRRPGTSPEFLCLAPGTDLRSRKGAPAITIGIGPWRCVCLGPTGDTTDKFALRVRNSFERKEGVEKIYRGLQSNTVSRVLALVHEETGCTVLLTGDSRPRELRAAMEEWQALYLKEKQTLPPFRTVKVSHHGAKSCHLWELYGKHCCAGHTRAVITAEDMGEHPHRVVVSDLVGLGIDYRVTGSDRARGVPGVPFPLPAPTKPDVVLTIAGGSHDYPPGGRLSQWHPRIGVRS